MGELVFALLECVIELLCMGATGRVILLVLLIGAGICGFGYWMYIS